MNVFQNNSRSASFSYTTLFRSSELARRMDLSHALTMLALRVGAERAVASAAKVLSVGDLESMRSEEHTSELQSRGHLVCRLLLEKKKVKYKNTFAKR